MLEWIIWIGLAAVFVSAVTYLAGALFDLCERVDGGPEGLS